MHTRPVTEDSELNHGNNICLDYENYNIAKQQME